MRARQRRPGRTHRRKGVRVPGSKVSKIESRLVLWKRSWVTLERCGYYGDGGSGTMSLTASGRNELSLARFIPPVQQPPLPDGGVQGPDRLH